MPDYALGKKPPRHDPRTLQFTKYLTSYALSAPVQAHWGHGLPFQMLGNDAYGDCVEAGFAHQVQVWCDRAGHPFTPTTGETLGAYSAITGFSPDDPSSDQGTDMLTACRYWKAAGFAGHKADAYLAIQPAEVTFIKDAIAYYGGCYIGLAMPLSAQNQVGDLWTVTSGPDSEAGSWGGHCVNLTGYDADTLWCCTWGALQGMTWEWLETYLDEAYVLLSRDWLRATGLSPSGLAWGALQADLANL